MDEDDGLVVVVEDRVEEEEVSVASAVASSFGD